MAEEKLHIDTGTVQETLVIPLFSRKLCGELYPDVFTDRSAQELMERLDYDFDKMSNVKKGFTQRYGALEVGMRQNDLRSEVLDYLKENPEAAVVNMGCGLDQTGEICYNESCRVYNLDVESVIEVRNQLIPPADFVTNIACDLNDFSWFDRIDGSKGAVFFAAGVFYYFKDEEIRKLFNAMAVRFPGGKLVFDSGNKKTLKMMHSTVLKQTGMAAVEAYFHVDSIEKDILPWLQNADASSRGYMTGYARLKNYKSVPLLYRFIARFGDRFMNLCIMRLDFRK